MTAGAEEGIRPAQESDLPAIVSLYNDYILHSPATFHTVPFSVEQRRAWFDSHSASGLYRLFSATAGGSVVGFASSGPFHERPAYASSVTLSVYLAPGCTGRGLGKRLYGSLIEAVRAAGAHRAYGGVTLPNPASERLHLGLGFRTVATYHEVGMKFGVYHSVRWYELAL